MKIRDFIEYFEKLEKTHTNLDLDIQVLDAPGVIAFHEPNTDIFGSTIVIS